MESHQRPEGEQGTPHASRLNPEGRRGSAHLLGSARRSRGSWERRPFVFPLTKKEPGLHRTPALTTYVTTEEKSLTSSSRPSSWLRASSRPSSWLPCFT